MAGDNLMKQTFALKRRGMMQISLSALFAALIAAGTFISIPLPFSPVPIVLQNMFAILAGLVLGPVSGAAAVLVYLIAGAIGLPVFAGATGGIVHFVGPTGGFLLGYLPAAALAGLIAGPPRPQTQTPIWRLIAATLAATLLIYIPGVWRLKVVLDFSWQAAFAAGFIPFIIGDAIKGALAVIAAQKLRKIAARIYE
jgi:biotin transport system substrate-specific component